jgi:hypothetical protein
MSSSVLLHMLVAASCAVSDWATLLCLKKKFRTTNITFSSPLANRRPHVSAPDMHYKNRLTHECVEYSIQIFINRTLVSVFITVKQISWCENSVIRFIGRSQIEAVWEQWADQNILRKVGSTGKATACCQRSKNGGGLPKLRIRRQNILSRPRLGRYGYKKKQGFYLCTAKCPS